MKYLLIILMIIFQSCGPKMKKGWTEKIPLLRKKYNCYRILLSEGALEDTLNKSNRYLNLDLILCPVCAIEDSINQKNQAYKLAAILIANCDDIEKYNNVGIYFSRDKDISSYTRYDFKLISKDSLLLEKISSYEPY